MEVDEKQAKCDKEESRSVAAWLPAFACRKQRINSEDKN